MADALRAAQVVPEFGAAMTIHLVETSPALRERQAAALPGLPVRWHDELAGLPADRPLLLVANEFLDALPVRQFVRRSGRWHERLVGVDEDGAFRFVVAPRATPFPQAVGGVDGELADGTLLELGPAREAVVEAIAARLVAQGGMALLIDYGSDAAAHDRRHVPSRQPPCRRRPADRAGRGRPLRPCRLSCASPRAPPLPVRWPTARSGRANSSAGWGSPSACAGCCRARHRRSVRRSRAAATGS